MRKLFQNIWDKLRRKRKLSKVERSQLKFRQRYPEYKIGRHTYGVPTVYDWDDGTLLEIGDYCSIARNVQIFLGGNHRTDWISTYPFPAFDQGLKHITGFRMTKGDVIIGNDVWLCQNSTILSGISIGHGAIVAAGSVVTKKVENYSIVAGNPAKHIKWRFSESIRMELLDLAWWNWSEDEINNIIETLCSDDVEGLIKYQKKVTYCGDRKTLLTTSPP